MQHHDLTTRVANVDERDVLHDEEFQRALRDFAANRGLPAADVEAEARRCLDELSIRPADRYLRWVSILAKFMVTRSFERDFDVNREALDELKELAKTRQLVFLWSHKSHLDSFVFMQTLYEADFRPQPLSFAGINMAFAGFGALARHSGAIFLRRSFREDDIYKLVLRHFIDYLVRKRAPLSWSIEGTRSRTGKLMPPKLGLLQWVVDACQRASAEDALLVPVSISYDQIPEIDDYIAMQRGHVKRKESLKWFVDYIAGMKAKYGKIYVRFAEPVALSTTVPVADAMLTNDADKALGQKLAFEVCHRIEHAKPINATDLVALVLLGANGRGLGANEIARRAGEIVDLAEQWELPATGDLRHATGEALQANLDTLAETGLIEQVIQDGTPRYAIVPGRELAAAYYRNTVAHYFVTAAIAEVALAAAQPRTKPRNVIVKAQELRDLLKFEFFFKTRVEFQTDAAAYLDRRYPDWRQGMVYDDSQPAPLFGPGVLRSFIDAYRVVAAALLGEDGRSIAPADEEALVVASLAQGEGMFERNELTTESALSKPLFESALRLAKHRTLLDASSGSLVVRRRAFAEELDRAIAAIEHLQDNYNQKVRDGFPQADAARRSIA